MSKSIEQNKDAQLPQAEIVVKDSKRFIRTPKGTELPLLQLKGKDYLQVAHRLVWLREEHPNWQIVTKPLEINYERKYAIFRSSILNDEGRIVATGTKAESITGFADYIEKAETGATGRAIALCGFGTQFAPEFDEGERLADAPVDPVKKESRVVNPAIFVRDTSKLPEIAKRLQSKSKAEVCKTCGSDHLTIALTKADNPRNPNRPYWKCLNCPADKCFSHWTQDAAAAEVNDYNTLPFANS